MRGRSKSKTEGASMFIRNSLLMGRASEHLTLATCMKAALETVDPTVGECFEKLTTVTYTMVTGAMG